MAKAANDSIFPAAVELLEQKKTAEGYGMQLKVKRRGGAMCVRLCGELDHHTAKAVSAELDALIAQQRIDELILDLDELVFMDSSGLGMVLGRYRRLKGMGARLSFINVPPACDRLFNLSGVYAIAKKLD